MIPPKAIKPIRKNGRDSTEIAVGSLIAYRVFAQTQEGIDKAKKLIANNDEWLVPSMLPEYYDGIDSDLMTGKENDAIRAITGQLKEFYGLTTPSAGTQDFVDTRVEQIKVEQPTTIKEKKKNNLKPKPYAKDNIDRWSRLTGYELDSLLDYTRDQLRALASKYGVKRYSTYKDKNELAEVIRNTVAYQQAAPKTVEKKIEKVNIPKKSEQPSGIKIPQAHYIQGQRGKWEPEFENDIDHAVYFAGKSPLPKGAKQQEVLDWLKSLGLTYEQIHDHREQVLEKMRETIALPGVEEEYPYVYIDAVDQDFILGIEEDEEEFNEIEDDLEGLDDLLNLVRSDDDTSEEEVAENIEEEILDAAGEDDEDEGDIGSEDDIPDELLQDDVDPELLNKLLLTINKPKKESSYTSNKKIFDSIVVNFGRLQSTLDTINNNLERQNSLIKANIDTQLAIGELVSSQTELLEEKFDAILKEFEKQSDRAKDLADDEKRRSAEDSLESQRDAAGTRDIDDLTKGGGKSKRGSKIADYYKQKALMKLYRAMPRRLRAGIRGARKLKQAPSRIASRMRRGAMNRMPSGIKKVASKASAIRSASKMTRMPGVRTGPLRTAFAGMEYGERKGAGQSELQALGGTGAGLAGGAGGAIAGKGIGYAIGAGIGGLIGFFFAGVGAAPGALIGGKIGAAIGSVAGGWMGAEKASELADKASGADQVTGEHETGAGLTEPGRAILHGTEAVIPQNDLSPMSTLGGVMLAATSQYINSAGAIAAPIAPTFKGIAGQMAKEYDIPSTVTQTNVGGSLPQLDKELRKVKEKRTGTSEEEFTGKEHDLLNTQDEDNFAEKLLKMIDPEGKLLDLMKNINRGVGGTGDSTFFPSSGDPSGLADAAESLKGMSSASGPSGGANGCVWAVNKVYEKAGIKPPWGSSLYVPDAEQKMIAAGYTQVGYGDRTPGDVMVMYDRKSPPQAHIGVVLKNGNILSNSSSQAKFAWEATPEQYNNYYGGTGKIYRMPSTMAKTESNKLQPVATTTTPNLSSSGKRSNTRSTVSTSQHQIQPTTPITQSKPQQQASANATDVASARDSNQFDTQNIESDMGDMIAAEYGAGFPKTPKWMKQIEADYQRTKDKPFNPGTPKPGRGMGDRWFPQASTNQDSQIASLSRYEQESGSNVVLINNQSPAMTPTPSSGGTEIIQMGGTSSSELLKNLMLQRLNA
jgi:hypothetical protein